MRAALAASVALACLSTACAPEPTNLLLISLDTTRADHLSVYGYPKPTTPHLEGLAAEGVRFADAYSATATTGPSHATLFTSLHPYTHGLMKNGLVLDDGWITLAEVLADAGYATHGVIGSFALTRRLGFAQGFAAWDEDFDEATSSYGSEQWAGRRIRGGFDRPADDTTRRALAWLRARAGSDGDPSQPFFLFVHYFDPHDPYAPPERFRSDLPPGPERMRAAYDGEIRFVDEQIGVLLHGLAADDLAETTLVVVVGDHGEGLMDRGHMTHGLHLYDEGVHVPLLMRLPGAIPAGSVQRAPFGAVDLAPTILDLLGLPAADRAAFASQAQGASGAETIRNGREPDPVRPVYLTRRRYDGRAASAVAPRAGGEQHAVRIDRWKYFETPDAGPPELYDLASDPGERRNVASREPATVAELSRLLRAWRAAQVPGTASPAVGDDVREKLEALGYTE